MGVTEQGHNELSEAAQQQAGNLLSAAFVVNDDPTQILDVTTVVEQEGEAVGADIGIDDFVHEPGVYSLGADVLAELLAETTTTKECDRHEYD